MEPNSFLDAILQTLRACLASHHWTWDKTVTLVDADRLGIDGVFRRDDNGWKLAHTLFDYDVAHENSLCDQPAEMPIHYHTVYGIYSKMINLILDDGAWSEEETGSEFEVSGKLAKRHDQLMGRVHVLVPAAPYDVQIASTARARELVVSWKSAPPLAKDESVGGKIRITLHQNDTCPDAQYYLVFKDSKQ